MNPPTLKGLGLVGAGVLAGALAVAVLAPPEPAAQVTPPATSQRSDPQSNSALPAGLEPTRETRTDRKISALEARLEEQSAAAKLLEERLAQLTAQVEAIRGGPGAERADGPPDSPDAENLAPPAHGPARETIDYSKSDMQRALEAAGLDEETAEGIKLRGDQLAMTEMYLRDQATREGWLDTPRFRDEMEAIEAQRTPIRDELGDDAYDRYLFALGRTNRVIVNDVMSESVAQDVGLATGDLIVRYGETQIFAPEDLIDQTHQGPIGESVTLEVVRGGQRLEIDVPRGPLGLRIGPAQDHPDAS